MPWKKKADVPKQVQGLPDGALAIWMGAANSWMAAHPGDDVTAIQVGWGAVKRTYKKKGDTWVRRAKK